MQTTRSTRSSVLGKRPYPPDQLSPSSSIFDQLPTPDPTPKRSRTSLPFLDGDGNKENVPPSQLESLNGTPTVPRRSSARRNSDLQTPTRPRTGGHPITRCLTLF